MTRNGSALWCRACAMLVSEQQLERVCATLEREVRRGMGRMDVVESRVKADFTRSESENTSCCRLCIAACAFNNGAHII